MSILQAEQDQSVSVYQGETAYAISVGKIKTGKWQSIITYNLTGESIWASAPWSVRKHAMDQALNMFAHGRINGKEVIPSQLKLFATHD